MHKLVLLWTACLFFGTNATLIVSMEDNTSTSYPGLLPVKVQQEVWSRLGLKDITNLSFSAKNNALSHYTASMHEIQTNCGQTTRQLLFQDISFIYSPFGNLYWDNICISSLYTFLTSNETKTTLIIPAIDVYITFPIPTATNLLQIAFKQLKELSLLQSFSEIKFCLKASAIATPEIDLLLQDIHSKSPMRKPNYNRKQVINIII